MALFIILCFSDGPSIELVEPEGVIQAAVGSSKVLRCKADGSPTPSYQWLHKLERGGEVEVVSTRQDLDLVSVGYDNSGEYICRAFNNINGVERSTESDVISVQVSGQPQLLASHSGHMVTATVGDNVDLDIVLCSDPPPKANTWQWGGGVVLPAGGEVDTR